MRFLTICSKNNFSPFCISAAQNGTNITMLNEKNYTKVSAIVIAALCTLASSSAQQEPTYPNDFLNPMPLVESAMGDFHFEITSNSELAQRYFNQGFQLMYAFAKIDSARSFREASKGGPNVRNMLLGRVLGMGLIFKRRNDYQ